MGNTKETILTTALHLFAQNGYEAVSVSMIADELGITKGALYKHYKSKRDIFNQILARMEQLDAQRAREFTLPEGTAQEMEDAYRKASFRQLTAFSLAQFRYWTQEEFPASFRKMLTLEQYRSAEMNRLYQQYLAAGPLQYVADLFQAWNMDAGEADRFYGPMFLFYSVYDGAEDPAAAARELEARLIRHWKQWEEAYELHSQRKL